MNISASNPSLENIIIRQGKEKKRPSFASVFEKINKRTANMNRITPLNNALTNEQLFRYYLTETDPKLQVSDDAFGEDEPTSLSDLITNKSLKMSRTNKTIKTDIGDDDDDDDDDDKKDTSLSTKSRMLESLEQVAPVILDFSSPQRLDNRIIPSDGGLGSDLVDFLGKVQLEKDFANVENSPFDQSRAILRHGTELVSRIGGQAYNLGLNSGIDTNEFVANILKQSVTKGKNLENSLRESGIEVNSLNSLSYSPAKTGKIDFYQDLMLNHPDTNDRASTAIQSVVKGHFARKRVKELKETDRASTVIQSVVKGHFARKRVKELEIENTVKNFVNDTISGASGASLGKRERGRPKGAWGEKRKQAEFEASSTIQSAVKGHLARKKVKELSTQGFV